MCWTDVVQTDISREKGWEKSTFPPPVNCSIAVCLLYILRNTVYTPHGAAFSGPSLAVVCVRTSALERLLLSICLADCIPLRLSWQG